MNKGGALSGRLAKIRALMIIKRKVTGSVSNTALAKEFNVSPDTVKRDIARALKENWVEDMETQVQNTLGPLALITLTKALQRTDSDESAKIAMDIMKGLGVLKKPRLDKSSASEGGAGDELEYIRVRRGPQSAGSLPPDDPPPLPRVHAVEPLPAPSSAEESQTGIREGDGLDWLPADPVAPGATLEGDLLGAPVGEVD